jgi:hypothetical protein
MAESARTEVEAVDERDRREGEDREDRFGYPEDEEGVVYLDDDGNEITPEEFRERVRRKAERLRREGASGGASRAGEGG